MSEQSRRKLLKSIAAGTGVVVAGKSLPETWTKPVLDSVILPTHAQTSLVCCEGVFCRLDFIPAPIGGVAQVSSDCTIVMEGTTIEAQTWSGSGTVAADGSFSFAVTFTPSGAQQQVTGTVSSDCSTIEGTMGSIEFSDTVFEGATSIGDCAPSDIRLKSNIEALSISRKGYNLYKFQYIDEDNENTYVGVMAQDIISRNPEAIVQNESGFYMVRYAQLGLKMVTLKQWESEGPDSVELMH